MENPYSAPISPIEDFVTEEAATTYQPKFFALNGRINRLRYWAYNTGAMAIGLIIGLFFLAVIPGAMEHITRDGSSDTLYELQFQIPMIIGNLIMARRRLQDIELSQWFTVIVLIPFIGRIFALVLSFKKGTEGRNDYGPEPAPNTIGVWIAALALPVSIIAAIAGYGIFKDQITHLTSQM